MFSKTWIVLLVTTQVTNAGESTFLPHITTVNTSTIPKTNDVQLPNTTICGISSWFEEFPWMALIHYEKPDGERLFSCGGSLINKRYILTSASCIETPSFLKWKIVGVRLGEYNLDTNPDCIRSSSRGVQCAPPVLNLEVEETVVHESYDKIKRPNVNHDIALLRLQEEVEFSDTVRPICLPSTPEELGRSFLGQRLTAAGWGRTEIAASSSVKVKVQLPVIEQEICQSKYRRFRVFLDDGQFCAGGEGNRDTCSGDTGNAIFKAHLVQNAQVRYYAVGLVSFGPQPCGLKDVPGVYTNISTYVPWILNNLRP